MRRRLRLPCFYGRPSPYPVPTVCTGPPCQEVAQIHAATKSLAFAWNSTDFCQITKFLTRLISVLSLSRKNVHNHCCCPISAIILTTSKLEAILKIYRGSSKLSKWGRAWGGGGSKVKGGREWQETRWHLLSGQKVGGGGGGGEEANSQLMSCFQLHPCCVQYSRWSLFLLSTFRCGSLSRYKKGSGRTEQLWSIWKYILKCNFQ